MVLVRKSIAYCFFLWTTSYKHWKTINTPFLSKIFLTQTQNKFLSESCLAPLLQQIATYLFIEALMLVLVLDSRSRAVFYSSSHRWANPSQDSSAVRWFAIACLSWMCSSDLADHRLSSLLVSFSRSPVRLRAFVTYLYLQTDTNSHRDPQTNTLFALASVNTYRLDVTWTWRFIQTINSK